MDDRVLELMRRWNATEESLALAEQLREQQLGNPEDFELWEENWDHWLFFLKVSTQWVRAGLDGFMSGLNYAGVEVVAKAHGLRGKVWRACLDALQVIEEAVLEADAQGRGGHNG